MGKIEALSSSTKISKLNLRRIQDLKQSGYEPNDYIINQALQLLEQKKESELQEIFSNFKIKVKTNNSDSKKLNATTKISKKTLARIAKQKISGYEPNDYIIDRALLLLEIESSNKTNDKSSDKLGSKKNLRKKNKR